MQSRREFIFRAALTSGVAACGFPGLLGAESGPGGVSSSRGPNILFAISDDQSWPHAGAYGCEFVRTPAFDRVARDGVLFTNAYTPNAKCAPSRACILTGRNSWQLGAAANHHCFFPKRFRTYVEVLSECGYSVGFTGKGWGPGRAPGRQLTGPGFNRRRSEPPAGGMSNKDYTANFEEFLDSRPPGRPFCFWYGCHEPHRAYQYGSGAEIGGKRPEQVRSVPGFWPDTATVRHDVLDYAFEIEHFDLHLGRMLGALEKRGELDNTLVVVTSDNGMPFPRAKGQAYDVANHMPLAIMWRKGIREPGRVVDAYVSFIDFAPTFLEVAGVSASASGMAPIEGRSLTGLFGGSASGDSGAWREWVLIGKEAHDTGRPGNAIYPIRGLIRDGYLYLRNVAPELWPAGEPFSGYPNTDGGATKTVILNQRRAGQTDAFWRMCFGKRPGRELYDLNSDRDCLHNLAGDPAFQERVRLMETFMLSELRRQRDPRTLGWDGFFEAFRSTNPTRDLYERLQAGENVKCGWLNATDRDVDLRVR